MKKIENFDLNTIKFQHGRFRKNALLLGEILKLEIKDALEIDRTDFEGKYQDPNPLVATIRSYCKKHNIDKKFSVRKLENGESWLIFRIK